jgi:uncharacterized protein (TIGR00369 family)
MSNRAEAYVPLSPERAALWAGYGKWDEVYFPRLIGLEVEEVRADYCRMRLPWRAELTQPAGVVHGGAIAALVDSVVVPAIGSGYDERRGFVTIDMQLQYRGAVVQEDMVGEGWVSMRGRSIVFCEAEVVTASGKPVAKGMLTYRVLGPEAG